MAGHEFSLVIRAVEQQTNLADVDLFLLEEVENIRKGLKGNEFTSANILLTLQA